MKLRIKGDSLRLRVSRTELARLLNGERIEETIHFSADEDAKLRYGLGSDPDVSQTTVRYARNEIAVTLNRSAVEAWGDESQTGIYEKILIGSQRLLEVAVEKDFGCIDRSAEDNEDTFANPLVGETC